MDDFIIELPFGPPPILPDIGKELEEYLTKPNKLPIHNQKNDFKFWCRKINYDALYHIDLSPVTTTLKVERDLDTGELLNFHEIPVDGIGQTAKNSTSFSRPPGKATDDVRGTRTNYPFWPGGFDLPSFQQLSQENYDVDFENDLLTKAPGMSRGFEFNDEGNPNEASDENDQSDISDIIDLRSIVQEASNISPWLDEQSEPEKRKDDLGAFKEIEDAVIPTDAKIPLLKISSLKSAKSATKTEWAELLDTTRPVVNFHKKIIDPAVMWNFELDTFQKLAILKLEEHKHIFVAAHTSAGKTVVAEYAIGLSQKHCTKAIYTSPIKALSNQKYRDFKNRFEEVGLITGDYQVNQNASCLIMTTEILRSMLYAGSDVIRDLEFVIFDEVHYINDSERGHVWEEILIMLPDTVCIVMLSATVPNQLEFADWVGQIKRAKMYVVSTLKRPIPLQHYLYTGVLGKGENMFLIKNADGPFNMVEYLKAVENKEKSKDLEKAKKDKRGPIKPAPRQPMKSEKQYWEAFALFLQKYEKLPVVAFTLSRNKCDRNAEFLVSIDFTTSDEKSYINYCFNQSIKTLKPEDQNLPQIQRMGFLLSQGVGVHHSGILPILKEIVEILFQKGLVKFLFATETFAMGVNMPARTVAFDSITKYDGYCTRDLQPAEYIQMAGRAGRRGQDETGTVIILCKNNVEKADNLKRMMLGDPTKLQSQFRITYSMILNLMRVKGMRVEDIMSHSFKELHNRRKLDEYRKELKELKGDNDKDEDQFKEMPIYDKLTAFFEDAMSFIEDWNDYSGTIFMNPKARQELTNGKFIIITYKHFVNRLALILQTIPKTDSLQFKILILCDATELQQAERECDLYYQMLSLSKNEIFVPDAAANHLILTITTNNIKHITKLSIKIESDLVIKDWEQRQIPRFKDAPPSKTCLRAVTELSEKSYALRNARDFNSYFIRIDEFKITEMNLSEHISRLQKKRVAVDLYHEDGSIPDFESAFKNAFAIKQKEARKEKLEYLLSEKSLLSYPDYRGKVGLLRSMKYINEEDIVEMKGRVACEMGSNELIITELIFQGTFSKYEPAEIAALLSCLVFQGKLETNELELTEKLREGINAIEKVRSDIIFAERALGVGNESNEMEKLNYGLVKVVYEWAHGKAFAEIMELMEGEVQEGIIVRAIQQLNEILRDIKDAARLFGDLVLKKKMEEASEAIKRDIVFAASLYTQD